MAVSWPKSVRIAGGVLGLLGLALSPLATATAAAATGVNPFSGVGFTIFANGDAALNNSEIEGSVAATKTLTTTRDNYAVVHKVAGEGNYQVPLIDGVPTRLLAHDFASSSGGSAMFNVTNAGASSGTNEAKGSIKSVTTSGWTATQRADYVRVHPDASNPDFVVDLATRPWSSAGVDGADELARIKTSRPSVSDYVNPATTTASSCLANLAAHRISAAGSPLTLQGLSTSQANVLDYSQIAGTTNIKLGDPSYRPTATAPLVIQVPNGTTQIGAIDIEGWDASAGAQQSYSQYILLDLSKVTNAVTITGLKMGAIFAPSADVTMNLTQTWNGQIIAKNFTANGSGELHDHLFGATLACSTGAASGKFAIAKMVTGLPTGTDPGSFTFYYSVNGGTEQSATVNAGQTWTSDDLTTGDTVTITEATPTAPNGYTYQGVTFTGDGITTNGNTATLTIGTNNTTTLHATNTYAVVSAAASGKFAIAKMVTGLPTGTDPGSFTFYYSVNGGTEQSATVNAGQTWTSDDLTTGDTVTITEATPTAPNGYTYQGVTFTGDGITTNGKTATLTIGTNNTTTLHATNTYAVVSHGGETNGGGTDNGGGGNELAFTGATMIGPAVAVGLLLLGAGALLVAARRRA